MFDCATVHMICIGIVNLCFGFFIDHNAGSPTQGPNASPELRELASRARAGHRGCFFPNIWMHTIWIYRCSSVFVTVKTMINPFFWPVEL